jgi:NAD(P)H-binding
MALLRLLLADAYADSAQMERVLAASGLDWTVVRLNRLTDAPARGRIRLSRDQFDKPTGLSRADVAAALLDIVADDTTVRAALNAAGARGGQALLPGWAGGRTAAE